MNEPILGPKAAKPAGDIPSVQPAGPEATPAPVVAPEAAPAQPEATTASAATEVAPVQPEAVAPEQAVEAASIPERQTEQTPGASAESHVAPSAAPAPVSAPVPVQAAKDANLAKVERVLEDNLWDVYVSLPDKARAVFKKKGEETAAAIQALIVQTHVRASKIHNLVHQWLGKIPGVNEFFLLQESKIKTDQFVSLAAWIMRKAGLG